jgi:ArsR family transcriptional regulator, lead/cadmium/zinc/bismuth-responsive transcriptional repressor
LGSKKEEVCEIYSYDEQKVSSIQQDLSEVDIAGVSKLFKVIGDENRAKIAYALCKEEELCVCDVANIIGATVATTSHHLRTLLKHSIVKFRKEGKMAFYSIDDHHIKQLILIGLEHQQEAKD